jgi:hypothetical protein
MSDGVYVLVTKDGYRVAYAKNYDAFFGPFIDEGFNYKPNGERLKEVFGNCELFADEKTALTAANGISKIIDETDDGVMFIKNYPNYTFEELISGKAA